MQIEKCIPSHEESIISDDFGNLSSVSDVLLGWTALEYSSSNTWAKPAEKESTPSSDEEAMSMSMSIDIVPYLEVQAVQTFVNGYIPTELQDYREAVWLPTAIGIANSCPRQTAAPLSLRALAMFRVGTSSGDQRLVFEGRQAYSQALYALQQSLFNPKEMASANTIAACRFLQCYEMLGSGSNLEPDLSWQTHLRGLQVILKAGGLEKLQNLWDHDLLEGVPDLIMREAICERKSPGEKFIRGYRAGKSPSKTLGNQIWARGFRLAAILEKLEQCTIVRDGSIGVLEVVKQMNRLVTLDQQLQTWYLNFRLTGNQPIPYQSTEADSLYHYSCLATGQLILVYWALRLIISTKIEETRLRQPSVVREILRQNRETTFVAYNPGQRLILALDIMRSAPFFCQPTTRADGLLKLSFAYDSAIRELRDHAHVLEQHPWLCQLGVPLLFDREYLSPLLPADRGLSRKSACTLNRFMKLYYRKVT